MCTPRERRPPLPGVAWGADNGCYARGYPGHPAWSTWLGRMARHRTTCLFATAPDVVGDAAATWQRSKGWLPMIRSLGYPAALVAQDGLTAERAPWDAFDVLFLGGTTEFKLGTDARRLTEAARSRGMPVHMGRVNSRKRLLYAHSIGCTSVDGTHLTFRPAVYLPQVQAWLLATTTTN